jgi:hypothetical protein
MLAILRDESPPPGTCSRGTGEACCEAHAPGGEGRCSCAPCQAAQPPQPPRARVQTLVMTVRRADKAE